MSESQENALLLRLRRCAELGAEDEDRVRDLVRSVRRVPADVDLKSHGEKPEVVHVILEGFGCRYKMLPDGRRQIMAFLVPGDACDMQVFLLDRMDHGISTLTESRVAVLSRDAVEAVIAERPSLARAFWFSTLLDEAILREWLVNIGRRDAFERIAHLLWELFLRHLLVDRVKGTTFALPVTQRELADALGLSNVHVSRTLQRLKAERVIAAEGGTVLILDPERLRQIAGFDADYLHFATAAGASAAAARGAA